MVSTLSLERRLGRLGKPVKTHLVFVEDGETKDQAISRYERDRATVIGSDDMVHLISFVNSQH